MSARQWVVLALAVIGTSAALVAGTLYVLSGPISQIILSAPMLTIGLIGALIVIRQPYNRVGRVLFGGAILLALAAMADSYAQYSFTASPSPLVEWAAWFAHWAWPSGYIIIVTGVLLLFPTGRAPSPRWRPVMLAIAGYCGLFILGIAALPGEFEFVGSNDQFSVRNPVGITLVERVYVAIEPGALLLFFISLVAALSVFTARAYQSNGAERQQMKWLIWAVAALMGTYLSAVLLQVSRLDPHQTLSETLMHLALLSLFVGVPSAIGIAILRYRLYDIDLIIRKTLIYGVLSVSLAVVYISLVIGAQSFLPSLAQSSSLTVAVSTLIVASLFRPLLSRIQQIIDRRFYRDSYESARAIESFNTRLREEIHLDGLCEEVQNIVQDTMQPAHVSLWLKRPTLSGRSRSS